MVIDDSFYHRPPGIPEHHSAGGIVVRKEGGKIFVALIKEGGLDGYVLPKGHIEKGEDPETAARREISEEAGFLDLELISSLGTKERLNHQKNSWVIEHFFLFKTNQKVSSPSDKEVEYSPAEWFDIENLPEIFWREQRELITENLDKIKELV